MSGRIVRRGPLNKPTHNCVLPHRQWWRPSTRHIAEGDVWRCDDCGTEYELRVDFGAVGGLPFPTPGLFWKRVEI